MAFWYVSYAIPSQQPFGTPFPSVFVLTAESSSLAALLSAGVEPAFGLRACLSLRESCGLFSKMSSFPLRSPLCWVYSPRLHLHCLVCWSPVSRANNFIACLRFLLFKREIAADLPYKVLGQPQMERATWSWDLLCTCTVSWQVWLGWELPSEVNPYRSVAPSISL